MTIRRTVSGAVLALAVVAGVSVPAAAIAQTGDAARGRTLFQQRCAACHSVGAKAGVGPSLAGVIGRRAGATSFRYSPAMKAAGLVWDAATLDSYLRSPMARIPGARMSVSTPQATDRRDIIAYLSGTR